MDLRAALSEAQATLPITDRDRAAFRLPKVDTRLIAVYQPSTMREVGEREESAGAASAAGGSPPEGGAGGSAPLGLSEARNPHTPPARYGQRGLTANGARNIQRATAWLQDRQRRLSFWTVTLPDQAADWLLDADLWPQFQTRIRDALARKLRRRGLQPHFVAVVELHPARSMRRRRPVPHIHVVLENRRTDWGPWVLSVGDLDGLIRQAFRWCGGGDLDTRAAGNVQPVRKNCGAYMAKYMVKNRNLTTEPTRREKLPKVWWFWSRETRREVLALVTALPWGLIQWIHRREERELAALGLHRQRLELPDPRAPATWLVSWCSPAAFLGVVQSWLSARLENETDFLRFS